MLDMDGVIYRLSWDPEAKCFDYWAERKGMSMKYSANLRGRATHRKQHTKSSLPVPHPAAIGQVALIEYLKQIVPDCQSHSFSVHVHTAYLPSSRRGPVLLSKQVECLPDSTYFDLMPWSFESVRLRPDYLIDILLKSVRISEQMSFSPEYEFVREMADAVLTLIRDAAFRPRLQGSGPSAVRWELDDNSKWEHMADLFAQSLPSYFLFSPNVSSMPSDARSTVISMMEYLLNALMQNIILSIPSNTDSSAGNGVLIAKVQAFYQAPAGTDNRDEWDKAWDRWAAIFHSERPREISESYPVYFQLHEPGKGSEDWRLECGLYSLRDKSLMIRASDLWKQGDLLKSKFKEEYGPLDAMLLKGLDYASRNFSFLGRMMAQEKPEILHITNDEVYQLTQYFEPLVASGYRLYLPDGLRGGGLKPKIQILFSGTEQGPRVKRGELGAHWNFDWRVAMGDRLLSEQEFRDLTAGKSTIVQMSGKWYLWNNDEITSIQQQLGRSRRMETDALLKTVWGLSYLSAMVRSLDLEIDSSAAGGSYVDLWKEEKRQEGPLLPQSFNGELRSYQTEGLRWLLRWDEPGYGVCLADDMGLGKTVQIIAFLTCRKAMQVKNEPLKVLVICPMSILGNWEREINTFNPSLTVAIHHGENRASDSSFADKCGVYDVVITTPQLILKDTELFKNIRWHCVILDEAQIIKNPKAKQTLAVKSLASLRRIALTGTPIENQLSDLWSIMDFLNPGLLGSASSFDLNIAEPITLGQDERKSKALRYALKPLLLRRMKSDPAIAANLPEKIEIDTFCNLTEEQISLYQACLENHMKPIQDALGIKRKGMVLSLLTDLKQICNHPMQYLKDSNPDPLRSGKLLRVLEMLDEIIAEDDSCLIYTQFKEMGEILRSAFAGRYDQDVLFYHGQLNKAERESLVHRFQSSEDGELPLMILTLKAGGTGLNLTKANRVIHFDRWWNPAVEMQATDRAFRIGQMRKVFAYKLIAKGTLEEKIDELLKSKKRLSDDMMLTHEDQITEIDHGELLRLLGFAHEKNQI